ncbi:MAG: hypothetical protein K9L24_00955 [Spirochaetia bacterium]|nr:hypothetical protein [Spirochaetia bacterium]MCF7946326.1 hypothetical protein [Spirochaetia bacterium]
MKKFLFLFLYIFCINIILYGIENNKESANEEKEQSTVFKEIDAYIEGKKGTGEDTRGNSSSGKNSSTWIEDLRRGEIVFFGSLPFTYFLSSIGIQITENLQSSDRSVLQFSFDEKLLSGEKLILTFSLSAVFALADFIIEKIKYSE